MNTTESTIHRMRLNPEPFEMIESGRKTIELRLLDEKRRAIKLGDMIVFTNTATGAELRTEVVGLHTFASFEELYKALPLLRCGYTAEDVKAAHYSDMDIYYPAWEQEKYGVVGIELRLDVTPCGESRGL